MTRQWTSWLALTLALTLILAACGGGSEPTPAPTDTPEPPTATAEPTPEPTEAPTAEAAPAEAVTSTIEITETAAITETGAITEGAAAGGAEAITPTTELTATGAISEGAAAGGAEAITPTTELTATAAITETGAISEGAAATPAAGAGAVYDVISARRVSEIVGERDVFLASMSPDGAFLAWIQSRNTGLFRSVGQVCFFAFANADKSCYDAPEEFLGYPYQLYWSPDSSAITFTENPIALGHDSDIWLVNVADGSFVNRTDDGFTGSWATATEPQLDYLPMWSAADGMVYFWRVVPLGDFQYKIGLYRVSPSEGEAEEVRDLSDALSGYVPFFDQSHLSMDSISALSPDGATVAVALAQFGQERVDNVPANSVWLVSVSDTTAEPVQIMNPQSLQAGVPSWLVIPASPTGLSWTSDNSAVVVDTFANNTHAPLRTYYYVDLTSGESTPIVDFSASPSLEALFTVEADAIPLRYYSPWTASLAADGLSLLMYSDLAGVGSVLQAMLPPDGSLPTILASADTPLLSGSTRSSRAEDGKVLMYGVLFTTQAQE